MSLNKNALIRYKTIDACLQRRNRKWTLDDLVEACSDALYEYEGIHKGVSVRTVQLDIQMMRSEKLGYNAPIIVLDKKYYTYEDPDYTITKIPLTQQDLTKLNEVTQILQQFKGFSHFKELEGMVNRLQHKIYSEQNNQRAIIDFEKNDDLVGLSFIQPIYQAITAKHVLSIDYQSFTAQDANTIVFHPHLLKEYRNRWFVLGSNNRGHHPILLALDRIKSVAEAPSVLYREDETLNQQYFYNIIGVTKMKNQRPQKVVFKLNHSAAPYVLTKPLHPTQELVEMQEDGAIFQISVVPNFELERELIGFCETIEVISPPQLRQRIALRLKAASTVYEG
jgi:predicted DNA-binding transcriptional regulator YafY